jgi:hypothetical protein
MQVTVAHIPRLSLPKTLLLGCALSSLSWGGAMSQTAPPRAPANAPVPVVMFTAKPQAQAPIATPSAPVVGPIHTRPYSIVSQAQQDAASGRWNPGSLTPLSNPVLPPLPGVERPSTSPSTPLGQPIVQDMPLETAGQASSEAAQPPAPYRTPLRRITQDTGRAIMRDVPEGLANALPWVDKDRKNAPFNEVLGRVAEDLNRAAQMDPEWALPVQREVRALALQMDRLPAPPPLDPSQTITNGQSDNNAPWSDRPFRPRPIWPGASGRPEAQVRPVSIVTHTGTQDGPQSSGVSAQNRPSLDVEEDVVHSPRAGANRPERPARASGTRRR